MRKNLILLFLSLFFSVFSAQAEAMLSAEKGYTLSLSSSTEGTDKPSSITANRDKPLYLIGPFTNKSGKTQALRLGIELKDTASNECFYKVVKEQEDFKDGLSLVYFSFYPDFIIRNGLYEVRVVCMDMSKDEIVTSNWEPVEVPAGFVVPQVKIEGDEPFAYFPNKPYVGNPNNETGLSDAKLHFSLTSLSDIEKGELLVFVFEPGIDTSIGYFRQNIIQKAGVTEEYTAEYTKSGSQAADLEVGKTYELSFRFFENKKEQFFDWSYDGLKFSVVESGAGISGTFQDDVDATDDSAKPAQKFMLEDGTVFFKRNGLKYGISGAMISK